MSDAREDKTVAPKVPIHETASSADEHTAGLGGSAPGDGDFSFLEKPQSKDELGRLGPFRVLKELGRGGMGCVLLAEDTGLERQVALKVMLPRFAQDEKAKTRFLREARAAGKVHHDYIVSIHQVGEANGVPFIAMEFLKGIPLDKYLKEKGDLPLATVLRIGREIALGLQAAHKLGMIHRDIKPANVWLEAPKGRVKILDFGLARREEDGEAHLTQSGAIVGTPAYMAPEQASGEKLDGRADLFSLGVLLYRLATGTLAFTGPTTIAMLMQVANHEPPAANEVKPGVSVEMARIIAKLMAKKKELRYGSAAEFLADWERLMKSPKAGSATEVLAKPPLARGEAVRAGSVSDGTARERPLTLAAVKWIGMGLVSLAVAVTVWFLIPSGSAPVVKNGKEAPPPKVEPPALDATNAAEVQRLWAAKLRVPIEEKSPSGIVMMLIPPGELVKYPYRLGKYEVTQGEWMKVMGYNPSTSTKAANCPAETISWYDSVEFCNKLSEREGLPPAYELKVIERKGASIEEAEVKLLGGPGYRIPTDAEWEHGCRAGTQTKYCFGDDDMQLPENAWFDKNSGKKTHAVGELKPNGFGLYDIHGNVREWNEEILKNATTGASERVNRGGYWNYSAANCAVSHRYRTVPAHRHNYIGLRLAKVPSAKLEAADVPAKEPPPLTETNAAAVQSAWAAKLKLPVEATSPSGIVMVLIPPGALVDRPYRLGKYEVTQAEWEKVMGYNPSQFKGPNLPVEKVNWYDCVEFCNKLSEKEGLPPAYELTVKSRMEATIEDAEVRILGGPGYRIPSDPEWEHACRAGTKTKYCFGDDDAVLAEYAWYDENSGKKSHPVGELKPNGFGLYDIHGNVREWNEEMLKNEKTGAPERVLRGGLWSNTASNCAVSYRYRYGPAHRSHNIGLWLVRVPSAKLE